MEEILNGHIPFTLFAPNDEAFAKLPAGTVERLLKNKKVLKNILTYHVISGKVMSEDVMKMSSMRTLQGDKIKINVKNGFSINNAMIIKTDIECTNGVIHVIDEVLMPR